MLTLLDLGGKLRAVVVPKQHREIFAGGGLDEEGHARLRVRARARDPPRVAHGGQGGGRRPQGRGRRSTRALRSPDDLLVVAAGGPAGGFGAIVPPWYGRKSLAVTAVIRTARRLKRMIP